jgi:hypothetical protein
MMTRLDPRVIVPLHEIRDFDKLHDLRCSMEAEGWQGRPLLIWQRWGCSYQALTGTHRLEAAIQAGLEEIPVFTINKALYCEDLWWEPVLDDLIEGNDEDRVLWLESHGFQEAAQLMLWEVP